MRLLIISVIILFTYQVTGQNITFSTTKAADDAFEKYSYAKAAYLYKASLESSKDSLYVLQQLGLCYRNMNDTDIAEYYFSKVVSNPSTPVEFSYYYAQALASNSKYQEAKKWYKIYHNEAKDDPRAAEKIEALVNIQSFFADSAKFEIKRMLYNSPGLDFSPAIYKNGVVFTSSRPTDNSWVKTNFNWDESSFLDLYQVESGADKAVLFIDHILTKYHEGPLAFYDNENKVVFTRNNVQGKRLKKDNEGVTRLKLFFAESDGNGGWTNIQPFEFNSDNYSLGHPAINEEGTVMIFSSDMQGGMGQSDLYIVFKEAEKWSNPKNLGPEVNTAGKEMFPSLVSNNLFFASDGRGGLGGLDIFEANLTSAFDIVKVNNIGYPINSSKDDFGLVSNDNFRSGYFASARIDSLKDDIYYFDRDYYNLNGIVINAETNEPLKGADIFVTSEKGLIYNRSGEGGRFKVEDIDPGQWEIAAVKFEFEKADFQQVEIAENQSEYEVKIYLNPTDTFPVIFPSPLTDFLTIISEDSNKVNSPGLGDALDIKPIYYDFNKSFLRIAGENELDKLKVIMEKFPNLIIGLFSHTDERGNNDYNLILSQRRANAAFDYLLDNGVDPDRLQPTGKGESIPAIECEDCTDGQHQENRRTEFIIVGLKSQ